MDFLRSVADVLEIGSIGIDDEFRTVSEWCSLKAFGLLVMLENDYGAPLVIDEFMKLRTVRDLFRGAFAAFAAELLGLDRKCVGDDLEMGSVLAWDSVMHLRLVMEAEKRFGCSYPLEIIPSVRTIRDFVEQARW